MGLLVGDSFHQAMRRFLSLERRFEKNAELKDQYLAFIDELIGMGHMEKVPKADLEKSLEKHFYLPHYAVFKEASTTTKLCVVSDASAKTSTGSSLNDLLMVGPVIQSSLFDILIRFRFHFVAFSADVAKMYRQVMLAPHDRDFHRIYGERTRMNLFNI